MNKKLLKMKLINLISLLTPIISAFAGYFIATLIIKNPQVELAISAELFKFLVSVLFFAVPVVIIFIVSRNFNYILK